MPHGVSLAGLEGEVVVFCHVAQHGGEEGLHRRILQQLGKHEDLHDPKPVLSKPGVPRSDMDKKTPNGIDT